jgi:hypothetical protein
VPAQVLNASKLAYQDTAGNTVVVAFSKPVLNFGNPNAIFTFDSGAGAVNGSLATKEGLRRIDLTSIPVAASGVGIAISATRSPFNGGDGFARVGEVIATGINLGAVSVRGDLGRILAGNGSGPTMALKSLSVQSLGRFGTLTGATDVHTRIQGDLGILSGKGDVLGIVDVKGSIGTMLVGGSLIGDSFGNGAILATGDLTKGTIAGNVEGGTSDGSGSIEVGLGPTLTGGTIGSLTIGGDVIGGSQSGSGELAGAGAIFATHIKTLTIGGSLIAGTNNTTGTFFADGAVLALFNLGSITIKGSLVGNPRVPAAITAGGQQTVTKGKDLAIGSVTVNGRVEFGLIEAGVATLTALAYQPVDADAQIGSVTIGGDWIASSVAAGAVAGRFGFGEDTDAKMSGAEVRDDPNVSSAIGSVTIGGEALVPTMGLAQFGIVAEDVGKVKVGGTTVFEHGHGTTLVQVGLLNNFHVHEIL